jgi:hypothetical protein
MTEITYIKETETEMESISITTPDWVIAFGLVVVGTVVSSFLSDNKT